MATKSRYEKISLWTQNLAMKKSRYAKILLWRNLAMKEPRHGKVSLWNGATRCLHMRYICETLPFRKLMFAISFRDICCYRRAPEKSCEIFVWNLCEILFLKRSCKAGGPKFYHAPTAEEQTQRHEWQSLLQTAPWSHWTGQQEHALQPNSNTNMISISVRRLQSAEQFAIEVAPKHDFYRSDAVGEITPPWPTAQHMLL